MDLGFLAFNPSAANFVAISPLCGFIYLLACIWLSLLLTKPEK